jgi:hypothetical protein
VGTAEILRNSREGEDDDGRRVEDQRAAATAAAAATDADANDREKFFLVEDCCNFSCLYKHIARKGSCLKKILGSFSRNFCGPMQLLQLQEEEEELFVLVLAFGVARAQQTKSNPFS